MADPAITLRVTPFDSETDLKDKARIKGRGKHEARGRILALELNPKGDYSLSCGQGGARIGRGNHGKKEIIGALFRK